MALRKVSKICVLLLFSLALSGLFGCRSSKDIAKKPSVNEVKRLEQLVFNDGDFQSLNSKVEFKFIPKEGVSASMKGTLKIRRDSCIILSIQPFLGIEAVKCLIRKDSIIVVNRLDQTYAVEHYNNLKITKYINLELVQALLFNKVFIPGVAKPQTKEFSKFEWHKVKEGNYFRWPDENYLLDFCLNEDGQYNELRASNPERQEKIKVSYSQFQKKGETEFPNQVMVSTEGLNKTFKVQITYLKPDFDTSTSYRFDIPSKYKKVTMDELIKKFQKML